MTTFEGAESASEHEDIRQLIAECREDAYRLARHLVRSSAEAEDLAHTAILNVLRRADNISDAAHVRAYLLTAVRNAWRNQLRARGGRRFIGADYAEMIPSTDPQPEESVITLLDASIAQEAFESLSATSKEVIRLRYLESLSFPELADRLGITSVAARQRAHRAARGTRRSVHGRRRGRRGRRLQDDPPTSRPLPPRSPEPTCSLGRGTPPAPVPRLHVVL